MAQEYRTRHVLNDVFGERVRQHIKWGEQHHPDGTGSPFMRKMADEMRQLCEDEFAAGRGHWRHILGEEFFEAMAESDPEKLATELIHVAAVAVSWIEDIRGRVYPEKLHDPSRREEGNEVPAHRQLTEEVTQ